MTTLTEVSQVYMCFAAVRPEAGSSYLRAMPADNHPARGDGGFFESGVGALFGEFAAGEAETVAELDEHVQGHQECEGGGHRR